MSTKKDAGEILVYYYNQPQSWGRTRKKVEAEIKWGTGRIDNAFDHLRKLKLIDFKEHNSNIVALPAPGDSHSIRKNIRQTEIIWDQFLLGHSIHSQTIRNKS